MASPTVRSILRRAPLAGTLARIVIAGRRRSRDRHAIAQYLQSTPRPKLHLGCGGNLLAGWLNTDESPADGRIVRLDVTRPFPFADGSFDYVFSEHLIEHVTYKDGIAMLRECRRVLRPGGAIRISTPDLAFLVSLYQENKTGLQRDYVSWAWSAFVRDGPCNDAMVINNFVRDWGHRFIYDEKTLRHALRETGFADVRRAQLNESADPELRDLENERRMPEGFLRLESFTLEAVRA